MDQLRRQPTQRNLKVLGALASDGAPSVARSAAAAAKEMKAKLLAESVRSLQEEAPDTSPQKSATSRADHQPESPPSPLPEESLGAQDPSQDADSGESYESADQPRLETDGKSPAAGPEGALVRSFASSGELLGLIEGLADYASEEALPLLAALAANEDPAVAGRAKQAMGRVRGRLFGGEWRVEEQTHSPEEEASDIRSQLPEQVARFLGRLLARPTEQNQAVLALLAEGDDGAAARAAACRRYLSAEDGEGDVCEPEDEDREESSATETASAQPFLRTTEVDANENEGAGLARQDAIELIRDLGRLRDEGLLTQEEFDEKKRQILDRL